MYNIEYLNLRCAEKTFILFLQKSKISQLISAETDKSQEKMSIFLQKLK